MTCPSCGTGNEPGRKFCSECGAKLALACAACGTANAPDAKFCGECGARLTGEPAAPDREPALPHATPEAERRLVSVLFADLVGFTTLSETRDAEEVRELLSRYFDNARQVIGRYGGTVEKFIGDAVMAVWGAPVTMEDDAERAVRAALELVEVVAALGLEVNASGLSLRAGVVTGEAAVTVGAVGQGMVAGDLVNTASRVQAVADPGTVLVGDATRRMTEASIAYEDAGSHELKGKAEPLLLSRPVRVIAGRRGEGRFTGLEAPFIGREAELRLVKELFHATADEGRARVVSVIGVAGIGKSRLAWEFDKYTDGLIEEIWWQKGRCLPYGEGVAYWALAEMVRMRAGIAEDEAPAVALDKLRATIELQVRDPDEQAWIEPRLAHLLGLAERTAPDQQDLFSAWRLFFERMAEQSPAVLLFEDLHWADAALLDFIEYLLDWSRNFPLFILTLARPELLERRPTWGAGKRNFHSLVLEPLPDEARDELLMGLVPGLPEELWQEIRDRAEGVPLYAVETVRMLLDRGTLVREGGRYRLSGAVDALEVPETLHALIAARLDGLDPAERQLLEDASVLGRTFTTRALAAVAGRSESELEPLLASLLRKEILSIQADPRSPERGQYGFLHALVQKVAYDTLARKERKRRHLAAAAYLEASMDPDEIAEVIASHYLEAYRAAPGVPDAAAIKAQACERLARAGERAASLAATGEAERYFTTAAELADEPLDQAGLYERAGITARAGAARDRAASHLEQSIGLFEAAGRTHDAARVSSRLAETMWDQRHAAEAVQLMERSFAVLSKDTPDADLAMLAEQLGRIQHFVGEHELAGERIEFALEIAEGLRLTEVVAQALNTKAIVLGGQRPQEATALLEHALVVALEGDHAPVAFRTYFNLAHVCMQGDRLDAALAYLRDGFALARRRGDKYWAWNLLGQMGMPLVLLGEWDEALARADEMPRDAVEAGLAYPAMLGPLARVHTARGELRAVDWLFEALAEMESSEDVQDRAIYGLARAIVLRADHRYAEALPYAEVGRDARQIGDILAATEAHVEAVESALGMNDLETAGRLIDEADRLPPVEHTLYMDAHLARLKALLAVRRGEPAAIDGLGSGAVALFRELKMPHWLAVALVERAEWLSGEGRRDEAAGHVQEARELFEPLKAAPWLERLERIAVGSAVLA